MGSQMQAGAPKTVEIAGQKVPVVPKKIEVEVVVEKPVYKEVVIERPVYQDKTYEVPQIKVITGEVRVEKPIFVEREVPVDRVSYVDKVVEIPTGIAEAINAEIVKLGDHFMSVLMERLDKAIASRVEAIKVPKVIYEEEVKLIEKEVKVSKPVFVEEVVKKPVFVDVPVDKPVFIKRIVEVYKIKEVRDA